MDRKEKLVTIARMLAYYYNISEPDFELLSEKDIHSFITSRLNKINQTLKRCPVCGEIMSRKRLQGGSLYCKNCNKKFVFTNACI